VQQKIPIVRDRIEAISLRDCDPQIKAISLRDCDPQIKFKIQSVPVSSIGGEPYSTILQ